MSDYKVTDTELTSIANAIRAKTGKEAQIEFPTEFVSEIGSISGGGDIPMLTIDEWNALSTAEKQAYKYVAVRSRTSGLNRGALLYGEEFSDDYHESNDSKLGVLVYNNYKVWFFNGIYIPTTGVDIASSYPELAPYFTHVASGGGGAKSYSDNASTTWNGIISFSYPNNTGFRLLSTDAASVIRGTVWATFEVPVQTGTPTQNIGGAIIQMTEYETASDYIARHGA